MAMVEIRDHSIWIKHIHGTGDLKDKLMGLVEGDLIELKVDGFRGMWRKMDDGKDGRKTNGIRGLGLSQKRWHALQDRRGELVEIEEATDD